MLKRNGLSEAEKSGEVAVVRPTAEESIATKMANSAEEIGTKLMEVLLKKARFVAENPESIDDLESVSDIGTVVNISRKIAGLDKQESTANIALNFGAFWQSPSSVEQERPRVLEALPA